MSNFTPGPWNIQYKTPALEDCPEFFILRAGGYIATVDSSRDENAHNARLISAAPELLEALENLIEAYSSPDDRICCNGIDCGCMGATTHQQAEHYARAAIAKARGES